MQKIQNMQNNAEEFRKIQNNEENAEEFRRIRIMKKMQNHAE